MKSMLAVLVVQGVLMVNVAQAAMVCEGETYFGNKLKLTVSTDQSARVEIIRPDGSKELDENFENAVDVWDGHMTGLVTAPGLSVKYENHYGCIRKAVITTNIRGGGIGFISSVKVATCTGGSTPDELCLPRTN